MAIMDTVKKIFPLSFFVTDLKTFIISLVIYILAEAVCGCVIGFLAAIPILGIIFSILGSIVGLYALAGIVLSILVFLKVIQ